MNETDFKNRIKSMIQDCGLGFFKVHGSRMQTCGWPDVYLFSRIWTGWLELKVGKNPADPLQRVQIRNLRMQHVPAFVLRGITPKLAILEDENGKEIGQIILSDGPGLLEQLKRLGTL